MKEFPRIQNDDDIFIDRPFKSLSLEIREAVKGIAFPMSENQMAAGITDLETGSNYRGYLIGTMLEAILLPQDDHADFEPITPRPLISPEGLATIYDHYGLTGETNGKTWLQLHGHVAATTAAAATISNHLLQAGVPHDREAVITAALLHDAAKGKEIKQHGELASSLGNTDHSIEDVIRTVMRQEEVDEDRIETTILAATNTGRKDRKFTTESERRASIVQKGIEAAIVGLADARSVHMAFMSVDDAQQLYLERKKDAESQDFFTNHWAAYYHDVSRYLTELAPDVDLEGITRWTIHDETIYPTLRGFDLREQRQTTQFGTDFYVDSYTKGKQPDHNEDKAAIAKDVLILSDGATDKTGLRFEEDPETGDFKTGGEVAAEIVAMVASQSDKNGQELVDEVSEAFCDYYEQHNPAALTDSSARFAATMVVARRVGNLLVVTQVGDTAYRINGVPYLNDKVVDHIRAVERKEAIEDALQSGSTPDQAVKLGRKAILNALKRQHLLQNNAHDPMGYGIIDGNVVPEKFIIVRTFDIDDIETIELATDGYYGQSPVRPSIASWEIMRTQIEFDDPDKYEKYLSTKQNDDRTVIVAQRKAS